MRISVLGVVVACLAGVFALAGEPDSAPVKLLPGFKHEAGKPIHGPAGTIGKADGLKIHYRFGKVRGDGDPITSADFTDRAETLPKAERQWYKEQNVGGQPVHLAYSKKGVLHVSYPRAGVNFEASVKTPEDMADALLIVLTFSGGPRVK